MEIDTHATSYVGSITEVTAATEAFDSLKLPLPRGDELGAFYGTDKGQNLARTVADNLNDMEIEYRQQFCRLISGYMDDNYSRKNPAPEGIVALLHVPNDREIKELIVQDYSGIIAGLETASQIGCAVIAGVTGAILGGELADMYIEAHDYVKHLATGLATVTGVAVGYFAGDVIASLGYSHYQIKTEEEERIAEDSFHMKIQEFIEINKSSS